MAARPRGVPIAAFPLAITNVTGLAGAIDSDIEDAAYAAALSYADALRGLAAGNTSWAVIKLYYSAFYCIRAALLLDHIIPFHHGEFYLCDAHSGAVKKGGKSSHQWQWSSVRDFKRLSEWYYSTDSTLAYEKLRDLRENANYRFGFIDPNWPNFLLQASNVGLAKSFRTYRDDDTFFYTYLDDHMALAYPTRLLVTVGLRLSQSGLHISEERESHLGRVWPLRDKSPLL